MPLTPIFHTHIQTLINFFNKNDVDIFSINDILNCNNPNDNFFKIYINYPNSGIIAHKPICPDRPNLVAGYGDATDNGFWIGMFSKAQINNTFNSIQNFVNQIGNLLQLNNNSLCQRCRV